MSHHLLGGMAARGTCPRTVRCASVAMTGCVVLLLGMCVCATAGKVADLDIPRHAQADDPTLQKAVDAYRQARTLDSQLKRSERAVERQTQQLRKELKQTKVAAASANTHAFRQEVRMDEDLLNQAESETARDKRLVRQAESEMRGDKAFLENAYRSHKGWKGRGGRGGGNGGAGAGVLSAQDENALRDIDCPAMRCEEAQAGGFLPTVCSTPGDCPRIRCWDYQEQGACKQGRICSKPSRRTASCTPTRAEDASWTSAKCPGMHCSHAKRWGYTPVFCTIAEGEGDCPTMSCFDYADEGGCEGNGHQGFRRGRVCKKPRTADSMCATKWAAREAGGGGSGVTALSKTRGVGGEDYRGVSPLHNMHSSKAAWSRPKMVESRMAILIFLLFISLAVGGAFVLFKRHGAKFAKGKTPAPSPVPSYYGRL